MAVQNAKQKEDNQLSEAKPAIANPLHSTISPKKFAPETYSNIPPYGILYPVSPGFLKLRRMSSASVLMYIPAMKSITPTIMRNCL